MAAPIPRAAGPCRLLAQLLRRVHLTMLRRHYTQQARLAASIAEQQADAAVELMCVQARLRRIGQQLRDHGELPPHLPDHIEQGRARCEP